MQWSSIIDITTTAMKGISENRQNSYFLPFFIPVTGLGASCP
jgi:hypothetical protein